MKLLLVLQKNWCHINIRAYKTWKYCHLRHPWYLFTGVMIHDNLNTNSSSIFLNKQSYFYRKNVLHNGNNFEQTMSKSKESEKKLMWLPYEKLHIALAARLKSVVLERPSTFMMLPHYCSSISQTRLSATLPSKFKEIPMKAM